MDSSADRTQSNGRINESQDMPIENSQTEKQREKEEKKKKNRLTIQELWNKFKKRNICDGGIFNSVQFSPSVMSDSL